MLRTLMLSGALSIVALPLAAQTVRWNDRPTANWAQEAPRVRVSIDGPRGMPLGGAARVRFEVDENAYVTVVRVDDDGRMTILFPTSRNQRAAVAGGQVHYARNPRLGGDVSFVANDRFGGYVFALASFSPLDFSVFEGRDFERIGGYSRFTVANRAQARRPDVFIDRFAAAVLWDPATPYDFDVDYYHPFGYPGTLNAFAMCGTSALGNYYGNPYDPFYGDARFFFGRRTYLAQLSSWDRMSYPYFMMCRDWYYRLQCYSAMAMSRYGSCHSRALQVATAPTVPVGGAPVEDATLPNEGVVRDGLFAPTPLPVPLEGEPPPMERPIGRFDQFGPGGSEFDHVLSIPARATKKMKDEDARRERADAGEPARGGFDRAVAAEKTEKVRMADASTRAEPPSREPTRAKATGEPRPENASRGGFGTTRRPSEPRSTTGTDRVSRPTSAKPATTTTQPASIQGTTTDKKKPPM